MDNKKKLKNFLSHFGIVLKEGILVLLVLNLLTIFSPIIYADEPNYNDYELPIEFFDSLITYINNHLSYNQYLSNFTLNSQNMKTVYDDSIKSFIKEKIDGLGGNESNMMIYISPPVDSNDQLLIYFLVQNNTLANTGNQYKVDIYSNYFELISDDISDTRTRCIRVYSDGHCNYWTRSSIDYAILYWNYDVNNFDFNNTTYNNGPFFGVNKKPLNQVHLKYDGFYNYYFINGFYPINDSGEPVEPEESGDISSGDSGDSGENNGNFIDYTNQLNNIDNNITNSTNNIINNQNQNTQTIVNVISGEFGKISNTLTDSADDLIDDTDILSGDIKDSLGFEIAEDPYSNFWFTLTNNLRNALLGSKRSIDISFQNRTWTISLDDYFSLPPWLIIILTPFSTSFFTWVLVRQWKLIFDKLASGNIDSILKDNSEEGISNLF